MFCLTQTYLAIAIYLKRLQLSFTKDCARIFDVTLLCFKIRQSTLYIHVASFYGTATGDKKDDSLIIH